MQHSSSSASEQMSVKVNQSQPLFFTALTVFFLGFLAAVPLRVYLLMTAVDAETGFYISGELLVTVFQIVMPVLALLLFFLPFFQRRVNPFATSGKSGALPGIGLLTAGLLITYSSVFELIGGAMQPFPLVCDGLGVLSGFLLIVTGLRMFMRGFFQKRSGLYLLIIPVWSCLRLLEEFLNYRTVSGISERVLDIVTSCGGALTLFFLVALLCGANSAGFHRLLVSSASITALFGAVANLPRLLIYLLGTSDLQQVISAPHIINIGLAFLSVLLLIWYLTVPDREQVTVYRPQGDNGEVTLDYGAAEEEIFPEEPAAPADEPKPPVAPEPSVNVDSILQEISAAAPSGIEPESEPMAWEAPKPSKPAAPPEPQVNANGYTVLPTLADLDSDDKIDWDLTKRDQ